MTGEWPLSAHLSMLRYLSIHTYKKKKGQMLGRTDVGDDRRMAVSRYVMVGSDKINLIRFSPG